MPIESRFKRTVESHGRPGDSSMPKTLRHRAPREEFVPGKRMTDQERSEQLPMLRMKMEIKGLLDKYNDQGNKGMQQVYIMSLERLKDSDPKVFETLDDEIKEQVNEITKLENKQHLIVESMAQLSAHIDDGANKTFLQVEIGMALDMGVELSEILTAIHYQEDLIQGFPELKEAFETNMAA